MIDTAQFALPKPGHAAGRVVLSPWFYRREKRRKWELQDHLCAKCEIEIPTPEDGHFHHPYGSGMGGGKRDDRTAVVICIPCHLEEHGQLEGEEDAEIESSPRRHGDTQKKRCCKAEPHYSCHFPFADACG